MSISRKNAVFIFFLFLGFFIRLFLANLAISEFIWDMHGHSEFAKEILGGKVLVADCCIHNVGFSLFLAGIYFFFGIENIFAIRLIHIILDLAIAVIIFVISRKLIGKWTMIVFILYLLNPFTASYTGLALPEIITLFFIAVTAYIITLRDYNKRIVLWFFTGIILGFLVFTRVQYLFFTLSFIPIMVIVIPRYINKVIFIFIASSGFLLGSIYTPVANYYRFRTVSFSPPYRSYSSSLYYLFFTQRYPELLNIETNVAPEETRMWAEYDLFKNEDFKNFALYRQKYASLFLEKFRKEWPLFFRNALRNMVWLWDKRNLFYYQDPFYPKDTLILQSINWSLIMLYFWGIIRYLKKEGKKIYKNPLVIFTLLLFIHISLLSLLSNETRHSLPFYPVMMIWAGYGLTAVADDLFIRIK